jgi:putative tryptophan/tyrosine transport system substrate-binding protein
MRRRDFITGIAGTAVWPVVARGQQPRVPVVGVLTPIEPTSPYVEGFRAGMKDLGYADGENLRIEYRWAPGQFKHLPDLAADLVSQHVDVILTFGTAASLAAKKSTANIPIVMVGVSDPVGVELVASLAHPGGNVTGTSSIAAGLVGKQFQLLREIAPTANRIGALWNPENFDYQIAQVKEAEVAAKNESIQLQLIEARSVQDLATSFAVIDRERIQALHILTDPLFAISFQTLVELSAKRRIPAITGDRMFAEAGGLLAYGPSYFDSFKRAALYVDKILKGMHPADLPVEQPTVFEFVLNLRTAKAFGISVPTSILLRANEVIE